MLVYPVLCSCLLSYHFESITKVIVNHFYR